MSNRLLQLLEEKQALLIDGATGTNLFAAGLESGDAPELWNIDQPEKITALHQSFVDVGADIILTNSFGGNSSRLALHKAEQRVHELNQRAAELARAVADQENEKNGRLVAVAGSIGPTGEMLFPLGVLMEEDAAKIFAEQAQALADGGADAIWIETMSSLEELSAAVTGAKTTGLPIVTTMSFDTNGHTMMGISPKAFSDYKHSHLGDDVLAIGCNCGVGATETLEAIEQMDKDLILVTKANCGVPEYKDGEIRYSGTVESMSDYAAQAIKDGVRLVGGCCGTTPEHLAAMRKAIDEAISA